LEVTVTGQHTFPFYGNVVLPSLTAVIVPGAICDVELGAITFTGSGIQGVVGVVNDFLPKLICDGYLNVVQHGTIDVKMKRLILEATGTVGRAYDLSLDLPSLSLEIEGVFGVIGGINLNLPAIKENGLNSYNDIRGSIIVELSL
jgi:hypothetical protein